MENIIDMIAKDSDAAKISDELKDKIPGSKNTKNFWASGISVVIHPYSPKIPAGILGE